MSAVKIAAGGRQMLKKLLLGLVALIALFLIAVATRPGAFRIERSAQINAPAAVVFAQVNDFKHWDGWSPWAKLDPNMTKTIAGAPQGVGATYAWSGNNQVGEGRMTIIESKPNEKVGIKLEFLKPWQATNLATFLFDARGPATQVTWVMEGTNNFMGKAVAMFMDMDAVIGKEFEKGLAQMKTLAEAEHPEGIATGAAEASIELG
jgi:polyketide cyclase/dehydrase/lipid transport protein